VADLLGRIGREAGVPELAAILSERVAPTDLRSLMLHVLGAHAARRDGKERMLTSAIGLGRIAARFL